MDKQQQAPNNATGTRNYTTKTTLYAHAVQYIHHITNPNSHVGCTYNAGCTYSMAS